MADKVTQTDGDLSADTETPPDASIFVENVPVPNAEGQSGVNENVNGVSSGLSEEKEAYKYVRDLITNLTTSKEGFNHLNSDIILSTNLDRLSKTALIYGDQNPAVPSPQLQDITYNNPESTLELVSSPPTDFRVILYVKDYKLEEVCIDFTEDTMAIRLSHDERQLSTGLTCRRDSCYYFLLPQTVSKDSLSAQWTLDHFLVIQSRSCKNEDEVDSVERLIPVRVKASLRPKADYGHMKIISEAITMKSEAIDLYLGLMCRKPEGKQFRLFPSHLKNESVSMKEFQEMCSA